MSAAVIQYLVVGVVVLLAALYACAKYLPAAWRRQLVYKLRDHGRGDGKLARWLDKDGSCGSGCDTCGSCAPAPLPETGQNGRKVIQLHVKK